MEEQQQPPSLSLQIINGPRKGETLQFRPCYAIRIGRVVNGNNLPIKDPGISTKHLSIHMESGKWVLRDLDSSNGTTLDDSIIPPNTSFHLRDGSTVKIGEVTSIVVNFIHHEEDNHTPTRVEDKPVRGRRGKKVVEEPKSIRVTRNMTRNMKYKGVENGESSCLVDDLENVVKEKKKGGGGRGKKKLEEEIVGDGAEEKEKLQEECVGGEDGKEKCDDEKEKEKLDGEMEWPAMEKISLAEWFDFLEVYLPKQIHDETEEIVDSMRKKAERLREYVIMYENQKARTARGSVIE